MLGACSMYQYRVSDARAALRKGNYNKAVEELKEYALKESDDQLVYLLDYAMALQYAGRYQESNQAFQLADQISEEKDYHSLSRIAGSILASESVVQYKGEDFEKVLINAFGAINYLMLGNLESALVEARRLNHKLQLYKDEAKRSYTQNVFGRYISAIAWETEGNYDDAYIDYVEAYKLNPYYEPLKEDLIRAAILAQRRDEVIKWKKEFPGVEIGNLWKNSEYGELILVYQQGWGPVKHPHPAWPRIPKLYPKSSVTVKADLSVSGHKTVRAEKLYSVQEVAIKTMDEAYAPLIAKRVAARVAKHAVARELHKKNKALGQLTMLAMDIVDQADLRQWSTLPASLHMARVYLKAGAYDVTVRGLSSNGYPTGEVMKQKVTINRRGKTFLNWRSFD